jgi:adenylate cyclase
LDLEIALGWSLHVARGPGAPDREGVLLRAQKLCERLDDNLRLIEVLLGLIQFRLTRRDHRQALKLAHATVELARRIDAPAQFTQAAQYLFSAVLFTAGELEQAREHLERAEAIRTPGNAFPSSGISQFIVRRGNLLGQVLAHLGYPAAALSESGQLLARAQQLSDPAVIANTLLMDAVIRATLRDDKLMERAEEMISFSAEHGLPFYVTEATLCRGWALTLSSQAEEGIVEIRRSIAAAQATGGGPITGSCAFLAEAYGKSHRPEAGLTAVAKGLAEVERTGERLSEAELHRLKGELVMMQDPSAEAEAEHCLRAAIDVARQQSARLFELRATASLARLLKRQGKIAEARAMLAAIYNWFSEGFDTTDLKEAKALLDEMAQQETRKETCAV